MSVQEPVRSRQFLTSYVPVSCDAPTIVAISCQVPIAIAGDASMLVTIVLTPVEPLFPAHECVRVLGKLFTNARVALQKLLQRRMILHELPVLDQRRILPQLLLDFRMAVEEFVHVGDLPALGIVVLEWHAVLGGHATRGWRALSTCRRNDPEQQTQRHERHGA